MALNSSSIVRGSKITAFRRVTTDDVPPDYLCYGTALSAFPSQTVYVPTWAKMLRIWARVKSLAALPYECTARLDIVGVGTDGNQFLFPMAMNQTLSFNTLSSPFGLLADPVTGVTDIVNAQSFCTAFGTNSVWNAVVQQSEDDTTPAYEVFDICGVGAFIPYVSAMHALITELLVFGDFVPDYSVLV